LLRHFLEFSAAYRQNLVHNQNLVCAPPGLQSPAGLPAAAYLGAASPSRKTLRAGGQRLGSGFRIPKIAPFKKMFSRPVNSGWNPVPTSSNEAMRRNPVKSGESLVAGSKDIFLPETRYSLPATAILARPHSAR
jgi:hypothetical protein